MSPALEYASSIWSPPGGNLNGLKINTLDVAKKEVYTSGMTAQESRLQELTADLQSESGRNNCFGIARQMAREGRDQRVRYEKRCRECCV